MNIHCQNIKWKLLIFFLYCNGGSGLPCLHVAVVFSNVALILRVGKSAKKGLSQTVSDKRTSIGHPSNENHSLYNLFLSTLLSKVALTYNCITFMLHRCFEGVCTHDIVSSISIVFSKNDDHTSIIDNYTCLRHQINLIVALVPWRF